ncbi:MAG: VIT domain-containing protein [bacterium]
MVKDTHTKFSQVFILIFGVILPLFTVCFEFFTHMCASIFFDPIPTVWHLLLLGFVPIANLLVYMQVWKGKLYHISKLSLANGIAIGTSLFYTLLFLPLMPISAMAIMYMGMGLLPLTPLLSSIASFLNRRMLTKSIPAEISQKASGLWWGIGLSIGLLILFELPTTFTRLAMNMVISESEKTSLLGLEMLRTMGNEDVILKLCYERPGIATDIVGFAFSMGDPVSPAEARKIYYRVTGTPFNAVSPPRLSGRGRYNPQEDFVFDDGLGGETVAGRVKGLSLISSRMDGSMDGDAALSYLEWTCVFKNSSRLQREARAVIALPPGGVVSRLTLWIDGEEREAAFAARRKVKEAYSAVVRQRRDPVLITTKGPDRVLVQCFPVPPDGEMKIRFGITSPLYLTSPAQGIIFLPCFLERNFDVPESIGHDLWIESESPLIVSNNDLKKENPSEDLYAVRGRISNKALSENRAIISTHRRVQIKEAWTGDPRLEPDKIIRQIIKEKDITRPSRIIFVIDSSRGMKESMSDIADALIHVPAGIDFGVIVASDSIIELTDGIQPADLQQLRMNADKIRKIKCRGGCDNIPSLSRAWEMAAERPKSTIVWIHSAQPIIVHTVEVLRQKWERRPGNPRLYDIQVAQGPNKIIEELEEVRVIESIARTGGLAHDLASLFSRWSGTVKGYHYLREKVSKSALTNSDNAKETSSHLARLWAYDRIEHLTSIKDKVSLDEAIFLATTYHLVTSVSGAVVLENEEQYTQAGLKPVDQSSVPTIPEPELWMLILMVFCISVWVILRRRSGCSCA